MHRDIVIHSGGVDSTTVLHQLLLNAPKRHRVVSLSIVYGSRSAREAEVARSICAELNRVGLRVDHWVVDLRIRLNQDQRPRARALELMSDEYRFAPSTYPHRNTLFVLSALSVLESCAVSLGDTFDLYLGIHKVKEGEEAVYPDTTPEWLKLVNDLSQMCSVLNCPPKIIAPFVDAYKEDIIVRAYEMCTPLHLTRTCYRLDEVWPKPACNMCNGCVSRRRCFERAGLPDPIDDPELWRKRFEEKHRG